MRTQEFMDSLGLKPWEAEQVLLAFLREKGDVRSRADLFLAPLPALEASGLAEIHALATRRRNGEPLQHVLGFQQFLGHEYKVGPGVFIPRPETECLVEVCAAWLRAHPRANRGFEIGLGSGIVSIELLSAFPSLTMVATEVSPSALRYAQRNADLLLHERKASLTTVLTPSHEILESFAARGRADFLVSNPPYLSPLDSIDDEVRCHDPREALFPESLDPNHFYRRIAGGAQGLLREGGAVFVELDSDRAREIQALFEEQGWRTTVTPDLTGRMRVLAAELHG